MDKRIKKLVARIAAYCKANNMAESTFGLNVVNDGKMVPRLRKGGTVTLRTLDKIEEVLDAS